MWYIYEIWTNDELECIIEHDHEKTAYTFAKEHLELNKFKNSYAKFAMREKETKYENGDVYERIA